MKYNVIKHIRNSSVITPIVSGTVTQLSYLVDTDTATTAISLSMGEKASWWIDLGSPFAISEARLWCNATTTSGTTFEYNFAPDPYSYAYPPYSPENPYPIAEATSVPEDELVWVTASSVAISGTGNGYVYVPFTYPNETPRYLRITHTAVSGVINIQELQVINNEDFVDFGTDGTQETLQVDHAPVGYMSQANALPIYNDSDELVDAIVMIENTNQPIDNKIKICATEDGAYVGREDAVLLPTQVTFSGGEFNYTEVFIEGGAEKVRSTAKAPYAPSGTNTLSVSFNVDLVEADTPEVMVGDDYFAAPFVVKDSSTGTTVYSNFSGAGGTVRDFSYRRKHIGSLFAGGETETITSLNGEPPVTPYDVYSNTAGGRYGTSSPILQYLAQNFVVSATPDPYSNNLYVVEIFGSRGSGSSLNKKVYSISILDKYTLAHKISKCYDSAFSIEFNKGSHTKTVGVGTEYIYVGDATSISRLDKNTLEYVDSVTYGSSFHDGWSLEVGMHAFASFANPDIVYVFGPVSYISTPVKQLSFVVKKIDFSVEVPTVTTSSNLNFYYGFNSSVPTATIAFPLFINGIVLDLSDQLWVGSRTSGEYSAPAASTAGYSMFVVDCLPDTPTIINYRNTLDTPTNLQYYPWSRYVYGLALEYESGNIYAFHRPDPYAVGGATNNHIYRFKTASDVYVDSFSSSYATPIIDLGASYNSSTLSWGTDTYVSTEKVAKYTEDGKSISEIRGSNVLPTLKYGGAVGEQKSHIPLYYSRGNAWLPSPASSIGRSSICYDPTSGIFYVASYQVGSTTYGGFSYYNKNTGEMGMLAGLPTPYNSTNAKCYSIEYLNGKVYAFIHNGDNRAVGSTDAILEYSIIDNIWAVVWSNVLASTTSFQYITSFIHTCVNSDDNFIYFSGGTLLAGSVQYYPYNVWRFDPAAPATKIKKYANLTDVFPVFSPSYVPNTTSVPVFGLRLIYTNFNSIKRLWGFLAPEPNCNNLPRCACYDVSLGETYVQGDANNKWSTLNPYINGTIPAPTSIWDGNNYLWWTSNALLYKDGKIYAAKGTPTSAFKTSTYFAPINMYSSIGQYARRFGYYSLETNTWTLLPDLPAIGGDHEMGSSDELFFWDEDENILLYAPFSKNDDISYSVDSISAMSTQHLTYLYNIEDVPWVSGDLPDTGDSVWGGNALPYEEVAEDSLIFPQRRYVQAKFYFNNSATATAKLTSVTIPKGITIPDVPPRGSKNVYVKTDLPENETIATKTAKLKVWWSITE